MWIPPKFQLKTLLPTLLCLLLSVKVGKPFMLPSHKFANLKQKNWSEKKIFFGSETTATTGVILSSGLPYHQCLTWIWILKSSYKQSGPRKQCIVCFYLSRVIMLHFQSQSRLQTISISGWSAYHCEWGKAPFFKIRKPLTTWSFT